MEFSHTKIMILLNNSIRTCLLYKDGKSLTLEMRPLMIQPSIMVKVLRWVSSTQSEKTIKIKVQMVCKKLQFINKNT